MADRQAGKHIYLLFELKVFGTLVRHAHHFSYQEGPKAPLHTFFVLTSLGCFDMRTSLPEKIMFSEKGNIPL